MGARFSKRREAPVNSGETAAEEPAATQPAEDSGKTQTQGTIETENLDVVVQDLVKPVASLPPEECVAECKEAPAVEAPVNDAEPEAVVKDTPAPVQSEPLVSVSEPSPPEPESAIEPKSVPEVQLDPEPASEAVPEPEPVSKPEVEAEASEPVPEPEPTSNPEAAEPIPEPEPVSNSEAGEAVPEPESTSNPEAEDEAIPEPISEPVPLPAEAPEQQTDMVAQEFLPEPEIASPALIDLGVPDATPEPINTPDEPSDISVTEESQETAEGTAEPEKSEETSECLEVEAAGNLEQLVSDVSEESVRGLLQNLELKGSDLLADFIPNDVKNPDDTPITDMSITTELM